MLWDLKKVDTMFFYARSISSTSVAYNQPVAIQVERLVPDNFSLGYFRKRKKPGKFLL